MSRTSTLVTRQLAMLVALAVALLSVAVALAHPARASSQLTFTGDAHDGGSWSNEKNWSPQQVPEAGDSITIQSPVPGGVARVTGVPSGTLVQDLSLSGPGAELSGGSITVTGSFSWTGGTLSAPVSVLGTLAVTGAEEPKYLHADLTVNGLGVLSQLSPTSFLQLGAPAKLTVNGTLQSVGDNVVSSVVCCVDPARIVNHGTIQVQSGTLLTSGNALDQLGRAQLAKGATLQVQGGLATLGAGSAVGGGGTLLLSGTVSATVAGTVSVQAGTTVEQAAGQLHGSGTITGAGTWRFSGGNAYARLVFGPQLAVRVSGSTTPTVSTETSTTPASWTVQGTMTIEHGATLGLYDAGNDLLISGRLVLEPLGSVLGTVCCAAPPRVVSTGTVQVVPVAGASGPAMLSGVPLLSDGAVDVAQGQELALYVAPGSDVSGSTFPGGGTLSVSSGAVLNASGTIPLGATTLTVGARGGLVARPATTLTATSGGLRWTGGTVAGAITLDRTAKAVITGPEYKQIAQSPLGGPSRLITAGTTTVEAGTSATAPVQVDVQQGSSWYNSGTATVAGNTSFTSSVCCTDPAKIENKGQLSVAAATGTAMALKGVELDNSGVLTVRTGSLTLNTPSYVQTTGTTEVQKDATLAVLGVSGNVVDLRGGWLSGEGTVRARVLPDASATVSPGRGGRGTTAGVLTVVGTYEPRPGGHLALDLGGTTPGTGHDQLVVVKDPDRSLTGNGQAVLAGVVDATTTYTPASSDVLQVVTAAEGVKGAPACVFTRGTYTGMWRASTTTTTTATALALTPSSGYRSGCDSYLPQAPRRANGSGTRVSTGSPATVQLPGLPAGADAVTLQVTVSGATAPGVLSVGSGTASGRYSVVYAPGRATTAQVTVPLTGSGVRLAASSGSASVALDVQGAYVDAQKTVGDLYRAVTPKALPATTVTSSGADLPVAGKVGVPKGATYVSALVTVSAPTAAGSLAVGPGGTSPAGTSAVSFGAAQTVTNLVTVPLSAAGTVRLQLSSGSAKAVVTVLGYGTTWSPGAVGSFFAPLAATTLNPSGNGVGTAPTTFQVAGQAGVPATGATAVLATVALQQPSTATVLRAGTAGTTLTAVQQAAAGVSLAAPAVFALPSGTVQLALSAGTATALIDVLGYFVG